METTSCVVINVTTYVQQKQTSNKNTEGTYHTLQQSDSLMCFWIAVAQRSHITLIIFAIESITDNQVVETR